MSNGWAAIKSALAESAAKKAAFESGEYVKKVFPVIIKAGEAAGVLSFIDDEPTVLKVHTVKKQPKGFVTRLCRDRNCPDCSVGDKAKIRAFFTVVDHRERSWINREGVEVISKDELRYFECSPSTADMLFEKVGKFKKKNPSVGGLTDLVIEVEKYGSGTATTTSFEIEERGGSFVIPDDAAPINFRELFSSSDESNPKYD
jgi:hypothetical protein